MKEYLLNDVLMRLEDGCGLDCEKLSETLRFLDAGRDEKSVFDDRYCEFKWGQKTFSFGDVFIKARYECVHKNRSNPFFSANRMENDILSFIDFGIPTAKYYGKFSVKSSEGWIWSGVFLELLCGYIHPDESSAGVDFVLKIIDFLRNKCIVHPDIHPGNILYKSEEDFRIIDFDGFSLCAPGSKNAASQMAHKYLSMLSGDIAKKRVKDWIYAL